MFAQQMERIATFRRVVLVLTALVFVAIAIGSLVSPHRMAAGLGYTLDNTDALNEFRAIYVGLWIATAALFIVAAKRIGDVILGDLAALLLLGQTGGRLVSLVLNGVPTKQIYVPLAAELVGGVAILVLRPRRQ